MNHQLERRISGRSQSWQRGNVEGNIRRKRACHGEECGQRCRQEAAHREEAAALFAVLFSLFFYLFLSQEINLAAIILVGAGPCLRSVALAGSIVRTVLLVPVVVDTRMTVCRHWGCLLKHKSKRM